jgi:hypothetical protein
MGVVFWPLSPAIGFLIPLDLLAGERVRGKPVFCVTPHPNPLP